jgi:hypothetical protein
MVDEVFLQNAVRIRRTYLKLSNNMDLYQKKAQEVASRLDDTLEKVDELSKKAELSKKSNDPQTFNLLNELMEILKTVESDGTALEELVDPLNRDIEKLAVEEQELYRLIKEKHFDISDDDIIKEVQDRLKQENLY